MNHISFTAFGRSLTRYTLLDEETAKKALTIICPTLTNFSFQYSDEILCCHIDYFKHKKRNTIILTKPNKKVRIQLSKISFIFFENELATISKSIDELRQFIQ
jgi:hypothetical protein